MLLVSCWSGCNLEISGKLARLQYILYTEKTLAHSKKTTCADGIYSRSSHLQKISTLQV